MPDFGNAFGKKIVVVKENSSPFMLGDKNV
jgi:hypothetical protein